jgi:hypothetical protein
MSRFLWLYRCVILHDKYGMHFIWIHGNSACYIMIKIHLQKTGVGNIKMYHANA